MRPFHSILSGLLRLLQLVMPASWGRGRGMPSNNGKRKVAKANGMVSKTNEMVSKAPPCTNGNQNQVTPRKHENVDNPTGRNLTAAEEELAALERMGLMRPASKRWRRERNKNKQFDPDRIYPYMIYARVPKCRQPKSTRDWYESFIPKVPDDTDPRKKPALTSLEFYGFDAVLSPRHVEEMKKKMPGFISSHVCIAYLQ